MRNLIIILFVLTFTALFCDDIRVFIDDGTVIEGELLDVESNVYFVRTGGILNKIPKTRITQVDNIEIINIYEYPNMKLLPISFIAFALSWDYYKSAGDLSDAIDKINDINEGLPEDLHQSTSALKSQKSRKLVIGSIIFLAGSINTYIALDRIKLETKVNYIGLRWKF